MRAVVALVAAFLVVGVALGWRLADRASVPS